MESRPCLWMCWRLCPLSLDCSRVHLAACIPTKNSRGRSVPHWGRLLRHCQTSDVTGVAVATRLVLTQGRRGRGRGRGWMPLGPGGVKSDFPHPQLQSSDLNPQHPDGVREGRQCQLSVPINAPAPPPTQRQVFSFAGIAWQCPGAQDSQAEQLSAFKRDASKEESFLTPG